MNMSLLKLLKVLFKQFISYINENNFNGSDNLLLVEKYSRGRNKPLQYFKETMS